MFRHTGTPLLAVLLLAITAGVSGAGAAPNTITPTVQAGAQAQADRTYLGSVNSNCTHHVKVTGNDANPGTSEALAWRTIAKAISTLRPGQTGCVHRGAQPYQESGRATAVDGTATAPITLRGLPVGQDLPAVQTVADDPLITLNRSYWVVENLDINKMNTDDHAVRIDGGHHVTVRNLNVHDGRGVAAVAMFNGAHDISVEGNDISRFERTVNGARADSHAVAVLRDSTRVLVRGNTLHRTSGDGVQCQGMNDDTSPSPTPEDSSDITLEDNRIYDTDENGYDIKSCQRVSIRGSVSPDHPGDAANNKLYSFQREGAIVIHYYARGVLVENTRIFRSCEGIAIGKHEYPAVRNVVVRRSLFFEISGGSPCGGNGVRATNAQNLEIYDNTFDQIPNSAVSLGADNAGPNFGTNYKVWNNIINDAGVWVNLHKPNNVATTYKGDRNLFRNPDGSTNRLRLNFSAKDLPEWRAATGQDLDSLAGDPAFVVDPASTDYYTQPGSPARDNALPTPGATACGRGPDIGFRESCF